MVHSWILENSRWQMAISSRSAEMRSLTEKTADRQWLWQPDDRVWKSTAPLLFPVVGRLVHNGLWDDENFYPLPAHGFLRNQAFALLQHTPTTLRLINRASKETLRVWPFMYSVQVDYTLLESGVRISWRVMNQDSKPLCFSLGYHPGFALPLSDTSGWRVVFSEADTMGPFYTHDRTLSLAQPAGQVREFALTPETFRDGAVYFAGCQGGRVSVVSPEGRTLLQCQLTSQPWVALWGVPGADLLCIEPLSGTTDAPDASGQQRDKRGMQWLAAGAAYQQELDIIFPADGVQRDG
ncbi:aldose epimerase family protein [Atlantibacter hermannii]|uniref:aldose epimerase family protein n=1 Tax=Atlantibacter hermannii TaxID=565 RepID=UPI0028AD0BE0|nr:hypothetical protein [Atlantibacter hermannii]